MRVFHSSGVPQLVRTGQQLVQNEQGRLARSIRQHSALAMQLFFRSSVAPQTSRFNDRFRVLRDGHNI